MSDPVAEAVEAVEEDRGESERPGFSDPDRDRDVSDSDPDREISSSDPDLEIGELPGAEEPAGSRGIVDRLMDPLDGSVRQDRIGELWNPDDGGANRLVLVAEEVAGLSDGLPRVAHLILGIGEMYVNHADGLRQLGSDGDDGDGDDDLTIDTSQL